MRKKDFTGKYHVVIMNRGHSPFSSGAKIMLLASVVVETIMSKVVKIMKKKSIFL